MTTITAGLVKDLRERTGAGMMECKKALTEVGGDIEAAIEYMRKNGMAKAAKKADRTAAEGVIIVKTAADGKSAAMVEINSETDFVARDANFNTFANHVADLALQLQANDIATLLQASTNGQTLEEERLQLIAKIGEKIDVRRVTFLSSPDYLGAYVHNGRIGALVAMTGGSADLAKGVAMHVAASRPQVLSPDQVPAAEVEKEKAIFTSQALESGKAPEIIEKMIGGRISKFVDEVSLLGQPFVKDPNIKVGQLLKNDKATVTTFTCYEVGEGIEKKEVNFRDEVMAQVKGSS